MMVEHAATDLRKAAAAQVNQVVLNAVPFCVLFNLKALTILNVITPRVKVPKTNVSNVSRSVLYFPSLSMG